MRCCAARSDFAAMDFPTRDLYRRAIEELARESGRDEVEVAKRAIAAARRAADQAADKDPTHGAKAIRGIISSPRGRRAFEKELGCRVPFRTRLFRLNSDLGVMSYVGMIAIVTAIVLALVLTRRRTCRNRWLAASGLWRLSVSFRHRMSRSQS